MTYYNALLTLNETKVIQNYMQIKTAIKKMGYETGTFTAFNFIFKTYTVSKY